MVSIHALLQRHHRGCAVESCGDGLEWGHHRWLRQPSAVSVASPRRKHVCVGSPRGTTSFELLQQCACHVRSANGTTHLAVGWSILSRIPDCLGRGHDASWAKRAACRDVAVAFKAWGHILCLGIAAAAPAGKESYQDRICRESDSSTTRTSTRLSDSNTTGPSASPR